MGQPSLDDIGQLLFKGFWPTRLHQWVIQEKCFTEQTIFSSLLFLSSRIVSRVPLRTALTCHCKSASSCLLWNSNLWACFPLVRKKNHCLWEAITSQLDVTPPLYSCIQRQGSFQGCRFAFHKGPWRPVFMQSVYVSQTPASARKKTQAGFYYFNSA